MHDRAEQHLGASTILASAFLSTLTSELRCPLCGSPYDAEATRLIREQHDALTVAVQCHGCGTGALLSLPIQFGVQGELSPAERIYFAYRSPISRPEAARLRWIVRTHCGPATEL